MGSLATSGCSCPQPSGPAFDRTSGVEVPRAKRLQAEHAGKISNPLSSYLGPSLVLKHFNNQREYNIDYRLHTQFLFGEAKVTNKMSQQKPLPIELNVNSEEGYQCPLRNSWSRNSNVQQVVETGPAWAWCWSSWCWYLVCIRMLVATSNSNWCNGTSPSPIRLCASNTNLTYCWNNPQFSLIFLG